MPEMFWDGEEIIWGDVPVSWAAFRDISVHVVSPTRRNVILTSEMKNNRLRLHIPEIERNSSLPSGE